ncbi:hypothetical protein [Tuwongella immobilis]|uniref:DUF2834 domain-containing protein n=1 Tax=Tuwongella immobilis TaxID=692036 RepID=A0A6C2YJS8_9BACT|nr:hypothetical protein [Tuwongella immobilis]VIP01624.1 unnamed protein product [Tuwongella immobilis]VTR98960.1 unnamed protein product [Tuwongella immobilis]
MRHPIEYTRTERWALIALAVVGFLAVNGAFLAGLLFHREWLMEAMSNPVALAFIGEALLLVGVFAYLFERWGVSRLHWGWFVGLSLLGSMAFAIPIVLLFPKESAPERTSDNP